MHHVIFGAGKTNVSLPREQMVSDFGVPCFRRQTLTQRPL
ncbi:hypothetical protein AM1_3727 [Acaryochloris marina MBIC11017]|uniref:Uncharacterized protein n=1 Tax=Acaryochloris marina (strain MBIC 11017) TaxID=329726 RepID=B0C4H3_ACAM1|nr:hypothetical protein AM1_3727 [Acaryochloris marina MBIC11017]